MNRTLNQKLKRFGMMETIDHKRTISSEQSHYSRRKRKLTLENNEIKRSLKPGIVHRKNQSLPRALASISDNKNIRSRKLYGQATVMESMRKQAHDSKVKTIDLDLRSIATSKGRNLHQVLKEGMTLFDSGKYEQALNCFLEIYRQIEERSLKNLYFLGLTYFKLKKLDYTIQYLQKCLNHHYNLEDRGYSSLVESYEQTKNNICALNTLNQWIQIHPNNPSAYLLRGRLNMSFKEYEKAIHDYQLCYQHNPKQLEAYIEEAEVTYQAEGLEPALHKYNTLLVNYHKIWPSSQYSSINYVKYRKSLLLIQEKDYQAAITLLVQITNAQLQSEVNYYMGVVHSILGNEQQAQLAYQRAIQANTSNKFSSQACYEKLMLLFKKHNYYVIQHELDLVNKQYRGSQALELLSRVIEGLVAVLKMNFQEGVRLLTDVESDPMYKPYAKKYKSTVGSFKAFAYYSLRQYQQCIDSIQVVGEKRISASNQYNLHMAQGIIQASKQHYNQAMSHFVRAQKLQPFNSHTQMVQALVQILFYTSLREPDEEESFSNKDILLSAEELLSKCLLKQKENDQILYLISVICYELEQYNEGLKFIRKAIDSSDDHTIKHYYLKANLKVMLDMVEQAVNDYTNALIVMKQQQSQTAEEKQIAIPECYLQRAKCYILLNQKDKAEMDLRTYFSELECVKKNQHELELFLHVGAPEIILEIYEKILQEEYQPEGKMKCYYVAKQLNSCLGMMEEVMKNSGKKGKLAVDRNCLAALKVSSQGSRVLLEEALEMLEKVLCGHCFGEIFTKAECLFFAGVMCFCLKDYSKAKNYFIDSKGQKLMKNQIHNSSEDSISESYENKTYTLEQINYNIGLCDFIQGKWSSYLEEYSDFVKLNRNQRTQNLLASVEEITPFPVKNRLCSIYQPECLGSSSFRLSFCLPSISLTPVSLSKNPDIINSLTFKDIEMRGSAPWIVKNKTGIVFTDDLMKESIDLKSEKSSVQYRNRRGEDRYKEEDNDLSVQLLNRKKH